MSLMVSISGVRGIVGDSLTPDVVVRYTSAFGEYCKSLSSARPSVFLGRDGRTTGKLIGNIVSSTLLSMGVDVRAIGVCPTPTVGLAVERSEGACGISVTASHNPMEWNGLKFIGPSGTFLDTDQMERFLPLVAQESRTYAPWEKLGTHEGATAWLDTHLEAVLAIPYVNPEQIRKRKLKVVVDCINAAGGLIVPRLLREFGCEVVEMNCEVSGEFTRTPEPLPENLTVLGARVIAEQADLGIAVDPDVDRLVLITEQGEPYGEEYTIASAVGFVLEKAGGNRNTVVVNLSTTRAVDDLAARYGASVVRTPVGEINVVRKMLETGSIIGGEGSGGVILPSVHAGRDALVGIALILQMLTESNGTLSQLKSSLPSYKIAKGVAKLGTTDPDQALERIRQSHGNSGKISMIDGLKIDYADSWIHLRKSNTEPIVRVIAEAATDEAARKLVARFTKELHSAR